MAQRFVGPVADVRRFGAGHINETFLASNDAQEYVVQRINTAVFPDPEAVMANIVVVHGHLQGALMPEPVATPAGEWLAWDGPNPWRAWQRVPGHPLDSVAASPEALYAAGGLLGRFHGLVADLDPDSVTETLPSFHDPARRLAALREVIADDPYGRASTVREEIRLAEEAEPLVELAAELTRRSPRRVAHFDAKLDNILFDGGDAVALVDFDTVMPGAWFWDVGDLSRSAASTAAEDEPSLEKVVVVPERYRAIVDGYRHGLSSAVDPLVIDAAGAIVTYEQAVRFLTDWIAGDVYYRISRPEHNLDRARNQFRLLASMPRP